MTKAIVSLSGGQDSATCLSWAKSKFDEIYSISFYYGQKHQTEIECAEKLSELANVKKHFIVRIDQLFDEINISNNAMVRSDKDVNENHHLLTHLPSTFVPFRNLFLLSAAAAKGLDYGINDIVTGICQIDYSNYPDCREIFRYHLEDALSASVEESINVKAPLMFKTKAEIVELMKELGTLDWYEHTHTCYEGMRPACGKCPACKLRLKGFQEAGINDPIEYLKKVN